jgi:hypothetical protein
MRARTLTPVILALLSLAPIHSTNLLLNGDVSPVESPLPYWFDTDFTVSYSMIPTNDQLWDQEAVKRYIRLYTPRNWEAMRDFDAVFHVEADFSVFPPKALDLFRRATEEGIAAICSPPFDAPYTYSWVNSFISEISPHDLSVEGDLENLLVDSGPWSIRVADNDVPLLSMFETYGIEGAKGTSHIPLYPKPGTTTWATMVGAQDPGGRDRPPFLISWPWEEGMVWVVTQDYDRDWWGVRSGLSGWDRTENPVSPDIVLNIIFHSVGRELPEDISVVHNIREEYRIMSDERDSLLSVFEFVQRFGANTDRLENTMDEIAALEQEAQQSYNEGDYQESLEGFSRARDRYRELASRAIELKDEALLWVYVIEWSTVLATSMICGSVLYQLMVRRRLYRETATTRSR